MTQGAEKMWCRRTLLSDFYIGITFGVGLLVFGVLLPPSLYVDQVLIFLIMLPGQVVLDAPAAIQIPVICSYFGGVGLLLRLLFRIRLWLGLLFLGILIGLHWLNYIKWSSRLASDMEYVFRSLGW